jgi:hypothetical protein
MNRDVIHTWTWYNTHCITYPEGLSQHVNPNPSWHIVGCPHEESQLCQNVSHLHNSWWHHIGICRYLFLLIRRQCWLSSLWWSRNIVCPWLCGKSCTVLHTGTSLWYWIWLLYSIIQRRPAVVSVASWAIWAVSCEGGADLCGWCGCMLSTWDAMLIPQKSSPLT